MGVTPDRLFKLGLIDEIIPEPGEGAHTDPDASAEAVRHGPRRDLRSILRRGYHLLDGVVLPPIVVVAVMGCGGRRHEN